jgi:hypothetical protein
MLLTVSVTPREGDADLDEVLRVLTDKAANFAGVLAAAGRQA